MYYLCMLTVLALTPATARAADAFQCPAQIDTHQQLAAPAPGWSAGADGVPNRLAGITFYDGKPEDNASLAPDKETKANGRTLSLWNFALGGGPIYVGCRYASTNVTLVKELPKQIRSCTITYNLRETIGGLPAIEKLECR